MNTFEVNMFVFITTSNNKTNMIKISPQQADKTYFLGSTVIF